MKLDQFTFTRFIAAFAIVVYHYKRDLWPFNYPFFYHIFSEANVGVSYFFILSGFVMIIAYGKNKNIKIDTVSYYVNRIARIFPVYILALLLRLVVVSSSEITTPNLLLSIFALQAWVPDSVLKINPPGWSISVEMLFYIAFPVLFNFIYAKYSYKYLLIYIVGFWIVSQFIFNYLYLSSGEMLTNEKFLFYFPFLHLNQFLVGNLVGFTYLRLQKKSGNYDLIIVSIFLILIGLLSFDFKFSFHNGLMAIVFVPFILFMALNTGKISKLFSNKYLIILGEASFSMYILQAPLQSICYFILKKIHIDNLNLQFYIFSVVLVVTSILCYYSIEIPARDFIKSLKGKKPKHVQIDDRVNF